MFGNVELLAQFWLLPLSARLIAGETRLVAPVVAGAESAVVARRGPAAQTTCAVRDAAE